MNFNFKQLIENNKVLIEAVGVAITLTLLNSFKLIDIAKCFAPAAWHFSCQPLLQALPVSILFTLLGCWCFSSLKDHELAADIASGEVKDSDRLEITRSKLGEWFNARRGEIGRICWAIAFFNLLNAFDPKQQPTLYAISLLVIGRIVQVRTEKLWNCWNAKYSSNKLERIVPGEYILFPGKLLCKVNRVGTTSLFLWRVFEDDTVGGNLSLPITMISDGQYERGTLKQLRQAIKEGA